MLGLVKNVEPYIKPKPKVEVPRADNFVFRLHYRVRKVLPFYHCHIILWFEKTD